MDDAPSGRNRHRLFTISGLTDRKLASIGAVAVLASHVEHYAEKAIWALEGAPGQGERPWTDSKPIAGLIARLEALASNEDKDGFGNLIRTWCLAARPTFDCRHSMFHGTASIAFEEWSLFTRNPFAAGVRRKRPPAEFHASDHTLALLEEAFENCLTGIQIIWKTAEGARPRLGFESYLSVLSTTQSISNELANLAAAVNHEKY